MNQRSGPDLVDPYAELPELYDLEHAGFTEDIDLYLRLAEVVGDPILELGCGTGRVLGPLAAAGHRITGVDRSQTDAGPGALGAASASAFQHRRAARDTRRGLHDRGRARAGRAIRVGDLLPERADAPVDQGRAARGPGIGATSTRSTRHARHRSPQSDPRAADNPRWPRPARGVLAEVRRDHGRSFLGADAGLGGANASTPSSGTTW